MRSFLVLPYDKDKLGFLTLRLTKESLIITTSFYLPMREERLWVAPLGARGLSAG